MEENKSAVNLNMTSEFCHLIRIINLPTNCTEDDCKKMIQSMQPNCMFRIKMAGIRRGGFNVN